MTVRNVLQRFPGGGGDAFAPEDDGTGQVQAAQAYVVDLEERLASEREHNEALSQRLRAMQNQLVSARRQVEEFETTGAAAKRALQTVLDERSALEKEIEAISAQRAGDLERTRASVQRVRDMQAQLTLLRRQAEEFDQGVRAAAQAARDAQNRLAVAQDEITRLGQIEASYARERETNAALRQELESARAAIHAGREAQNRLAVTQRELNRIDAERENLERIVREQAGLQRALDEQVEASKATFAHLQQLMRSHAAARTTTAARLERTEALNAELTAKLEVAQAAAGQYGDYIRAQIAATDREIAAITDMTGVIRTSKFWKLKTAITGSRKRKIAAAGLLTLAAAGVITVAAFIVAHFQALPIH